MELQQSHDDWDKVVMNITTGDKSMNDDDQYESLRGLSLRQLREAKQVRAVHRSMACQYAWNRLCERGHKSIEGTALTDKAGL